MSARLLFAALMSLSLTACEPLDALFGSDAHAPTPPSSGAPVEPSPPGPPVAIAESCDLPAEGDVATLPATVEAGAFTIELSADGDLDLRAGSRSLFANPTNQPWLALGEADVHAAEHQGSFDVDEGIQSLCTVLQVEQVLASPAGVRVEGTFADCPGADFVASFCELAPGHLGFDVDPIDDEHDLIVLRSASDADERVYGMGEQAPHHSLNLKGREIPVLAQEGGVGRGHFPITPAVDLVSHGSGGDEASTYYAAPHYLTSRNRSFFLKNSEYAVFDFRQDEATEVRLFAGQLRGQVLLGGSPLELVERFTDYAGRMPHLTDWANDGAIVALARPLDQSLEIVDQLQARGAAISGVWNQTWSGVARTYIGEQVLWNWVQNGNHHPGWQDWSDALEDRGVKTLCYVNSMFRALPDDAGPVSRDLYSEGLDGDYFVHDAQGDVLMLPVTAFDVALLDLTNEDARRWMKDVIIDEMLGNANCRGWMADFAEALPFEAVMYDGRSGAEFHNLYPVEWARLNREAVQEAGLEQDVLIFNRSGHTTTPRHSMMMWQGDQLTTWDRYDGLKSAVHSLISGGFSGIALNHSDIGGYTSLSAYGLGYVREADQLKRWTELSAFTSLMRTHEGNQPDANAQVYSDDGAMEHFARMTRVYRALRPVRDAAFADASSKGWPVVRHLAMEYPEHDAAWIIDDQFLLGDEVLVAPTLEKCWSWPCDGARDVWLPAGEWTHLWTGEKYGDPAQNTTVRIEAPLGEPAVFFPLDSPVGERLIGDLLDEGIDAGGRVAGAADDAPLASGEATSISCGDEVRADTRNDALANRVWDAYDCNIGNYEAAERVFDFVPSIGGPASFSLIDAVPTAVNHDVMLLEVTEGGPTCLTWGSNSLSFDAEAGHRYLLAVDGYDQDEGEFTAHLNCE